MRSAHSFPPLRAGLVMYLTRNLTPEASGALQLDQSETIHGSGTETAIHNYTACNQNFCSSGKDSLFYYTVVSCIRQGVII